MRDYTVGDTFDIKFTTRAFATGVPTTLAGSPVISAYPDNSVTQLTAGITLSVDFDGVAGLHNVRIVATGGNGYAAGSTYTLVITTGTVGGTSVVGECVGEFTLGRSAAFARLGAPAGASTAADVAAVKVDTAAIKTKTDALPADPADASDIATATAAIQADTDNIQTRLPAALVSGRMDASVGAMAANVLTATAIAADAITDAKVASDVTIASVTGAVGSVTAAVSILSGIRKNVALPKFEFLMTDSTTHAPVTGKTVTVTRSIDNGAFAAGTLSAVTEIAFGVYSVDFGAGDLNGTVITLRATAATSDDLLVTIVPDP